MRRFYYFKIIQTLATLFILMLISSTTRLYGYYTGKEELHKAALLCGGQHMVMFDLDMDIANINKFQETYVSAEKFSSILDEFLPTGQGYLDIPLDSAFGRFFGATINPLDGVSNIFALSIALSLIYLLLLAIHTVLLLALKIDITYSILFSASSNWGFLCGFFFKLFFLWTRLWLCTNFRPQCPAVVGVGLVISVLMIFSCIYELGYDKEPMHGSRNNNRKPVKKSM